VIAEDRGKTQGTPAPWTRRTAGLAFIWSACVFTAYLANGREIISGDTIPAKYLTFALVRGDGFYLDRYRSEMFCAAWSNRATGHLTDGRREPRSRRPRADRRLGMRPAKARYADRGRDLRRRDAGRDGDGRSTAPGPRQGSQGERPAWFRGPDAPVAKRREDARDPRQDRGHRNRAEQVSAGTRVPGCALANAAAGELNPASGAGLDLIRWRNWPHARADFGSKARMPRPSAWVRRTPPAQNRKGRPPDGHLKREQSEEEMAVGGGSHGVAPIVVGRVGARGVSRDVVGGRARLRPSRHWHTARTEARPPGMSQGDPREE
jgi:hypothetical protein